MGKIVTFRSEDSEADHSLLFASTKRDKEHPSSLIMEVANLRASSSFRVISQDIPQMESLLAGYEVHGPYQQSPKNYCAH